MRKINSSRKVFRPAGKVLTRRQVLGSIVSMPLPAICCPPIASAATSGHRLVLHAGNAAEPDTLDPHLAESLASLRILQDMYLGLMTLDPGSNPVLGAAASYQIIDERRHRFELRNAIWSNGEPVTAMDFLAGWQRAVDPQVACPGGYLLGVIENADAILRGEKLPGSLGVHCPDKHTLELTLARPSPYLPFLLTHAVMSPLPPGRRPADMPPAQTISNGPYAISEWKPGDFIRLVRNPGCPLDKPVAIDEVFYYPIDDDNTALGKFRVGSLDYNLSWPISLAHATDPPYRNTLRTGRLLSSDWIGFNFDRPPLHDPRLRRALGLALDRERLVEGLGVGQMPAYRLIPPYTPNIAATTVAVDYVGTPRPQRLTEARALIAAAGYSGDRPLRLAYSGPASSGGRMMAAALQSMWNEIGVVVEVQLSDPTTHYAALREGGFEVAFVGWLADIPDPYSFASALFSDAGPYMKTGYVSQAYDDLVRGALEAWDPLVRADMLARAEQRALDDGALAPLLFDTARNLVSPQMIGFWESQFNVHPARWIDFDLSKPPL